MHRHPLFLLALMLVVTRLVLAVLVWPDASRLYNGDSWLYEQHALSILHTGEWLASGYGNVDANPFADMIRPPGYPLLLVAVYGVVGADAAPWVMFGLNVVALIGLVSLLFCFMWMVGLRRAWPLLFILIVDPAWWMYSKELITEPWFTPLMVGAVMLVYVAVGRLAGWSEGVLNMSAPSVMPVDAARKRRFQSLQAGWENLHPYWLLIGGGLLLGLATWFKPITLYAPWFASVAIAVTLLVLWRSNKVEAHFSISETSPHSRSLNWRRHLLLAPLFFLIAALVLPASWQARNMASHGSFVYTSIAAENMMTGHAAFVLASSEGITHLEAQERIRERFRSLHPNEAEMSFAEQHDAKLEVASEILRANRLTYAKSILRGMAVTMMDPGRRVFARTFRSEDVATIGLVNTLSQQGIGGTLRAILQQDPVLALYAAGYMAFLALFFATTVIGAVKLYRINPLLTVMLVTTVLYLWVLGGPNGYARFRLYIMPFMIMLCAGWFAPRQTASE